MIEVVPFKAEHFKLEDLRDPSGPAAFGESFKKLCEVYESGGLAWTIMDNDKVVASGGVIFYWPGVGEGWMLVTKRARAYPLALIKVMKKGIDAASREMKLNRIHATVKCDDRQALRLAKILGFQVEGRLRRYGPDGKDYFMCGRVS